MRSASILLVMSVLATAAAQALPAQQAVVPQQANLSFVAPYQVMVGMNYGIDAIDGMASVFGQRNNAVVLAGRRTVAYSCPDMLQVPGGAQLTYDFEADQQYELVCEAGKQAEIREAGC